MFWKARPSSSGRLWRTDTETKRRKAASLRADCQPATAGRPGHGSVSARTRRCRFDPRGRTPASLAVTAPFRGRHEARSPRHPCGGDRRASSDGGEVSRSSAARHESRRGRCVGVNAAATGGVWARDPDVCRVDAPFFREGAETSNATTPCGWVGSASPVAVRRHGLQRGLRRPSWAEVLLASSGRVLRKYAGQASRQRPVKT